MVHFYAMFLFLDRDGVINERTPGTYVMHPDELILLPNVPAAVAQLRALFKRVFVVTNQGGIQKGLFTHADLVLVHAKMQAELPRMFDGVYYCPHPKEYKCNCRKPEPAMAWSAQFAYAEVKFTESWMVGDSASDMEFGKRLGMKTVRVGTKPEDEGLFVGDATPDFVFTDLPAFAEWALLNLKPR
jgi:D-glycero-D-manno-heptose 1,7-bisphosphate phosphatase